MAALVYFTLIRRARARGDLETLDPRIICLSALILLSAIVLNELAGMGMGSDVNWFTTSVVCRLYSIICCITVLFLELALFRDVKMKSDKELIEYMLELHKEQYKLSKETIDLINIKCHDLKHQVKALREMDAGSRDKALGEIEKDVMIYSSIVKTGNESLDIVLTEKSLICQECNIKFSYLVDAAPLSMLETVDIYTLFGNALDNAIESVRRESDEGKRIISLNIRSENGILIIALENYCAEQVRFVDGLPVTESDKKFHGFGTKSIRFIAEKYGGNMQTYLRDEMFYLRILLPRPHKAAGC